MKKFIISFIATLLVVINTKADNLVVSDQQIIINQSKTFTISMKYDNAKSYVSFQMDLTLPEGISINKEECSLGNAIVDEEQELTIGKIGDNKYRLTSTSFSLTKFNFYGKVLINLSLKSAEDASGGVATLSNIRFVQNFTNTVDLIKMDDVSFNISIVRIIEFADPEVKSICVKNWDQNGDGNIDTGEAASVMYLNKVFKGTKIKSFDELQYFTGLINGLTRIGSIQQESFSGCTQLTSVVIPDNVVAIEKSAFSGCSSLTSIALPNSVTSIGDYAFDGCSALTTLNIPQNITSIGVRTFSGCKSLVSAIIPNNVTIIGESAFYNCSSLVTLDIPNSVTTINKEAFSGCSSLVALDIPNSVTTINKEAFSECSSLTSLYIPSSVTTLGEGAFKGCFGLNSIVVDAENTYYDSRNNCNAIINTESDLLLLGCKNTTIPNNIKEIGPQAFRDCKGLMGIVIPNDVSSISQYAFSGCSGLTSITIPNSVTSIGERAFEGCSNLTSITIPESVKTIGRFAFYGCSSLASVTISEGVSYIGWSAFNSCSSLTSITIPKSITYIENYAFVDCSELTSVIVKKETPLNIGDYVFTNRKKATLYVPADCKAEYEIAAYWREFKKIEEMAPEYKMGDVDGDGVIDLADAVLVINYYVGKPVNTFVSNAADVDGDGVIDLADAVKIINYYVGKVPSLARMNGGYLFEPQ